MLLLTAMKRLKDRAQANQLRKACSIKVLVYGESTEETDVIYDLRQFEVPESRRIDLDPIIQRMHGMILVQDEVAKQVRFPKYKDRVRQSVQEQFEYLKGLQEARGVYDSRE
jgi:hypothetical protein